jgi:mRNA interferase RelE/StbE
MNNRLLFKAEALKERKSLDSSISALFLKKLKERTINPRVEQARLSGMKNCYKIRLRGSGYRLVYEVRDSQLIVSVVAVGKRERNLVYKAAIKRI